MSTETEMFSEQEIRLLGVAFEIVNGWAEVYVDVLEGNKTKEEAFDEFNNFLLPIGQVLAIALTLPGVAEALHEMQDRFKENGSTSL